MKRRLAVILLIFVLIAPSAVTYLWLRHQKEMVRKQVKHQMIEGIDHEDLVYLKFAKSELNSEVRWEHSKEFEYREQMYDIVERIETKDSVAFWCWWDYEETRLNRELKKLAQDAFRQNPQKNDRQSRLFSFLKCLYYDPPFQWSATDQFTKTNRDFFWINNFISISIPPASPPPRLS